MGILRCSNPAQRIALAPRCLIGRASSVQLRLATAIVSAEHACVYFDGNGWKVRDLGSTNGTYLNQERVDWKHSSALREGDALTFGGPQEPSWTLESAAPPGPSARASDGRSLSGHGGILWLPMTANPEACVRVEAGVWVVDRPDGLQPAVDGEVLRVGDEVFVLELPVLTGQDWATPESTVELSQLGPVQLVFTSSLDEEHVSLCVEDGAKRIELGARSHNYPLLIMARRRLEDEARGIPLTESGWLYASELRELLALDRVTLNLQLWRAKQAFHAAGLASERLVERRADSGQLRIGFERLRAT